MAGKTVLTVDDEPHIRYMLEYQLTRAGYTVIVGRGGREALELARRHRPHVIVSDYQMPGGDGITLGRDLACHPETAGIPVLMLTACGHRLSTDDVSDTNIRRFMEKPFSPRELLDAVACLASAEPTSSSADPGARAA